MITLNGVPGATQLEYQMQETILDVKCLEGKAAIDSFDHMLGCYSMRAMERAGLPAIDFLVMLDAKAKTSSPGIVIQIL